PAISPQTATLLQDLVKYYERLANVQPNNDENPSSWIATLRARQQVGMLHHRLGGFREAIDAFEQTIDRLDSNPRFRHHVHPLLAVELHNRKGQAHRLLGEREAAESCHETAFQLLATISAMGSSGERVGQSRFAYAKARTIYLLHARARPGHGPESLPPLEALQPSRNRPPHPWDDFFYSWTREFPPGDTAMTPDRARPRFVPNAQAMDQLQQGVAILDAVEPNESELPYLLLKAALLREVAADMLNPASEVQANAATAAIDLLVELRERYPKDVRVAAALVRTLADMNAFLPMDPERLFLGIERLESAQRFGVELLSNQVGVRSHELELIHVRFKHSALCQQLAESGPLHWRHEFDQQAATSLRQAIASILIIRRHEPEAPGYMMWQALFQTRLAEVLGRIGQNERAEAKLELAANRWNAAEQRFPDSEIAKAGQRLVTLARENLRREPPRPDDRRGPDPRKAPNGPRGR
ncbi:MAG: hypothetical protein AAGD07_26300, partial [Planctomycetota bacterium]